MDNLIESFDNLVLEKSDNQANKIEQLIDFVNLLLDEEKFEREYGFKLEEHIQECREFVHFLRDKVANIRSCNRGTGK